MAGGLVFPGVQLGRISPGPAGTQRPVDYADSAFDLLGELGDELVECLSDDLFQVADRSGDRGLINEQQFGDHFLGDVGAEVHDDRFHRLTKHQFPGSALSAIPGHSLFDALDELVELLGCESRSSLAWQWSLRGAKTIGVAFKFSRWDHCLTGYDTPERPTSLKTSASNSSAAVACVVGARRAGGAGLGSRS